MHVSCQQSMVIKFYELFKTYLEKAVEKPLEAWQIDVLRIRIIKDRQTAVGSEHIDLAIMYHIPDRWKQRNKYIFMCS